MKKIFIVLICFLPTLLVPAQIPAGYYDAAAGLTGLSLKTALYNIIKNHTPVSYNALYSYYTITDKIFDSIVWDMYSMKADCTANYYYVNTANSSDQCGSYSSEGDCYNREHTVPASWFNENLPMYTDLFNVYPTDGFVNNKRANFPYGKVGSASYTSSNGSKLGNCSEAGYSGKVFEPVNAYKGDLARTYFYMATRYENVVSGWPSNSSECAAVFNGDTELVFKPWFTNMLCFWCSVDPVSQKEIDRNNAVYSIQHNRNPYIDHPEWLSIWCPGVGMVKTDPTLAVSVFPNPVSEYLNIRSEDLKNNINRIDIYSFTSSLVQRIEQPSDDLTINVSDFPEGIYTIVIYGGEKVSRSKVIIIH
ncbi:MAG TPA: endonuclease [Bacteroidales bacterium]|nr:endonuclease [Bacteroidales bacterium]